MVDGIEQMRDMMKQLGAGGWVLYELMLRYGKECSPQPLPARYKMRAPKACFWNAQGLVNRSRRLRYTEGFVRRPEIPLLIHHAWAVDAQNRVVDPTLSNYRTFKSESHEAEYFGIVFNPEDYKRLRPRGGGSFLDSGCGYRISLWLEFAPEFEPVLWEALGRYKAIGKKTVALKGGTMEPPATAGLGPD
jgi:hypothetical protein